MHTNIGRMFESRSMTQRSRLSVVRIEIRNQRRFSFQITETVVSVGIAFNDFGPFTKIDWEMLIPQPIHITRCLGVE